MSGADKKALSQTLRIRQATACDHAPLADLWRRSVEGTHHFLPSGEVERLFHDVRNAYLPGVEILWVAELAPCGQAVTAPYQGGTAPKALWSGPSSTRSIAGGSGCCP